MLGKQRLAIVGTGWAGFELLRCIDRRLYDVHVISPRYLTLMNYETYVSSNYFIFTPLLSSTCTGTIEYRSITEPVKRLDPSINYYHAICTGVNPHTKTITCRSSFSPDQFTVQWDKLVISAGAVSNTFGIPGVQEHAMFLKEVEDARRIRHAILERFDRASLPGLRDIDRTGLLHFAIVGGGPTGVEFAAELHDFVREDLRKVYPDLIPHVKITIYDVAPKILGSFDARLAEYAMTKFARDGIQVATGSRILKVRPDAIEIDGVKEQIRVGLTIWATGLTTNPLVEELGKQFRLRQFRLLTDPQFNLTNQDESTNKDIYAIGDCATVQDQDLPCTAQVAYQKAQHLAKTLNKGPQHNTPPFVFKNRGMMAYLGNWKAIADLKSTSHHTPQSGRLAWLLWRSAYFVMTVSLRNKILIPMYWFLAWIFGRDISNI